MKAKVTPVLTRKRFLVGSAALLWVTAPSGAVLAAGCPRGLRFQNARSKTIDQLRDCTLGRVN